MVVAFMIQTIILISVILFAIIEVSKLKNIEEELVQIKEETDLHKELPNTPRRRMKKNLRKYHRAKLYSPVPCTIQFNNFGTDRLDKLKGKSIESAIMDISLGGLRLNQEIDLPVQFDITGEVSFTFEDHSFNLPCEFARKHVKTGDTNFTYGVQFLRLTRKDEHLLALSINQYESKNQRNLSTSIQPAK